MKFQFVTLLIFATAFSLFRPEQLHAQISVFCVERANEARQSGQEGLALAPSEAAEIVALISTSMALNRPVEVVPCDELEKGKLAEVPRTDVVGGDYIAIDTVSLSLVLNGDIIEEAYFLVAHELAHILNADWSTQTANIPRKQKEDRADIFGACAVARLGGDWNKLESFLKRLRHIKHKDYSLYADVSSILRQQFNNCAQGVVPLDPEWPPGKVFRDCSDVCPDMVVIPAGTFRMGASNDDPQPESWEKPQQDISISTFALGRVEITRREFERFVFETGFEYSEKCDAPDKHANWDERARLDIAALSFSNGFDHGDFPITCINWLDANSYIEWLNDRIEGAPYRLPSEAELEYAIRAGSDTIFAWGNDVSNGCEFANGPDQTLLRNHPERKLVGHMSCVDGFPYFSPVAFFRENNFKLFDTVGNVSEWTEDCYRGGLLGLPLDGSPRVLDGCNLRAVKGGSWALADELYLRSSFRRGEYVSRESVALGFRVARSL